MKVTLTRSIGIKGKHCDAGDTVEVDEVFGATLLAQGRAVVAVEKQKKAKNVKNNKV